MFIKNANDFISFAIKNNIHVILILIQLISKHLIILIIIHYTVLSVYLSYV